MKGMKRKLLKKLRSIPQLGYPEQHPRILPVHASDGVPQSPPPPQPLGPPPRPSDSSARVLRELPVGREQQRLREQQQQHGHCGPNHKAVGLCEAPPPRPEPDIIDVAELMKDLEDEEEEREEDDHDDLDRVSDKENIRPAPTVASAAATKVDRTHPKPGKGPQLLSSSSPQSLNRGLPRRLCAPPTSEQLPRSPFRRPDPNAASLFDPDLLAAFEQAVIDHARAFHEDYKSRSTALEQEQEEDEEREKQLDGGKGIHLEHPASKLPPTQTAAGHNEEREGDGDSPGIHLEHPPSKLPPTQTAADHNEEQEGDGDSPGIHLEHPPTKLPPTQTAADHNEEQEGDGDSPGIHLEHTPSTLPPTQTAANHNEEQEGDGDSPGIHLEHPPSKLPPTQTASAHNEEQEGDGDSPGGDDAVVLYTTSLHGVRKTFADCSSVRSLLGSLRVRFRELDVSMHLGYREELWWALGGRAVPPRLFVRGRYVGGADDVLGLHEQGRLLPLLWGLPTDRPGGGTPCRGCGGVGFVVCTKCSGSRKVLVEEGRWAEPTRCPGCNENGLVVCALCGWSCPPFRSSPVGKEVSREGISSHISSPFTHH